MEVKLAKRACLNSGVDRISALPENIIHHILFLTPYKDAARTTVLSKKWKLLWLSYPIFKFEQSEFNSYCMYKSVTYINKSLCTRFLGKLSLHKFILATNFDLSKNVPQHIDRWISFAIERKVNELDLRISSTKKYFMPHTVLGAKTLTVLRLSYCELVINHDHAIKFSNLQTLSLSYMEVDEWIIQKLILSCPLLEDLHISHCRELKNLQISTLSSLRELRVRRCLHLERIQVEAPKLQCFEFCDESDNYKAHSNSCIIELATSTLQELIFQKYSMPDEFLYDQISKSPCLEVLKLMSCKSFKSIKISSRKLRRLVLKQCRSLEFVKMDTPNLRSFDYENNRWPFYSIKTIYLPKPRLHFSLWDHEDLWFNKLEEFLEKYKHSKDLKLEIFCQQNLIIHEDISEIQPSSLYSLKDLKPDITISSKSSVDMADDCGRSLRRLVTISASSSLLLKVLSEKILNKEKYITCPECTIYCEHWWRRLKGLAIEKFTGRKSWDQKDLFKSYLSGLNHKLISLKLHWYETTSPDPESMINLLQNLRQEGDVEEITPEVQTNIHETVDAVDVPLSGSLVVDTTPSRDLFIGSESTTIPPRGVDFKTYVPLFKPCNDANSPPLPATGCVGNGGRKESLSEAVPDIVSPIYSSTLNAIFGKYGDITSDCMVKSLSIRRAYMDNICRAVEEMRNTNFENLKEEQVESWMELVKDAQHVGITVGWFQNHLHSILETMASSARLREARVIKNEQEKVGMDTRAAIASHELGILNLKHSILETRKHLFALREELKVANEGLISLQNRFKTSLEKALECDRVIKDISFLSESYRESLVNKLL